jgi:hypothetical protein
VTPALLELRQIVELQDAEAALDKTIANSIRFWSSEDAVLRQLYGVAAIDPAAQNLVDRQRNYRRGELERLVNNLHRAGRLRDRTTTRALNLLLVLTSYATFRELREAGLSDRKLTTTLQQSAHDLLLDGRGSR